MRVHILKNIKPFEAWIVYYLVVGIIQALWTNPSAFPPYPLRIAMILAVFGPVFFRKDLILLAIPFSMTLRGFLSTQYSFLPDIWSQDFYIYVILFSMAVHLKKLNFSFYGKTIPLIALLLFFSVIDLVNNGEVGQYATNIFIGLLLVPFLKNEDDFHLLSAAIITVSTLLAIYYIVMYDEFLEIWEDSGMERSGWSDPNYFSTTLDRGFFVATMYLAGFCKSDHSFFNRKLLGIACIFIANAVIMTASRAGFFCMLFVLVIAVVKAKMKFKHFLLALLAVGASVIYLYSIGALELLGFRIFVQGNFDTGGDRTTIWRLMLTNFEEQSVVQQLFGSGYWNRVNLTNGADLHNEFFSIMADYGLIGLFLFLIFFFSLTSFHKNKFWKGNLAAFFYFLSIISLSPFQTIYILFLIVWIVAHKSNLKV